MSVATRAVLPAIWIRAVVDDSVPTTSILLHLNEVVRLAVEGILGCVFFTWYCR
jgi:hypothetical protein